MANFLHFLPRLLAAEGGYCHTPGDAGQETWRGVARAYNPTWPGWLVIDAAKDRLHLPSPVAAAQWPALTKALAADDTLTRQVQAFYRQAYWDALLLDQVNSQGVAEQLADHGVNAGIGRPPRMLQYCLRQHGQLSVQEDGHLGPLTLKAANAIPAVVLRQAFMELRRQFYCFRAGQLTLPAQDPLNGLFARLHVLPNPSQAKFLPSWLARIDALPA